MTFPAWFQKVLDAWGEQPDEYFVVFVNRVTGVCGLAKHPAEEALLTEHQSRLRAPNNEALDQYFVGSLVRTRRL